MAGVALSLGFHVTLRLWEQTKSYEPLDLSPPFAAKPLPGTSLNSLIRRHGSQLPLLLNPTPQQPDRLGPPPPILTPNVTAEATPQPDRPPAPPLRSANGGGNPLTPVSPASSPAPPTGPGAVEPGAAESAPPLPPPVFVAPEVPPPPAADFSP